MMDETKIEGDHASQLCPERLQTDEDLQKRCFIHTRLHYLTLLNDLPSLQLVLLQCYEKGKVESHMMLLLEHSELCHRKLFPEKV